MAAQSAAKGLQNSHWLHDNRLEWICQGLIRHSFSWSGFSHALQLPVFTSHIVCSPPVVTRPLRNSQSRREVRCQPVLHLLFCFLIYIACVISHDTESCAASLCTRGTVPVFTSSHIVCLALAPILAGSSVFTSLLQRTVCFRFSCLCLHRPRP
jgi:hypothetical protein